MISTACDAVTDLVVLFLPLQLSRKRTLPRVGRRHLEKMYTFAYRYTCGLPYP